MSTCSRRTAAAAWQAPCWRSPLAHPRLAGLRRWNLVTRDAHALYRGFGFMPLAHSERHMERTQADFYRRGPQ